MPNAAPRKTYEVVIIGGGASGTALLYSLAKYGKIGSIALVEKYAKPGQVNSKSSSNSQTLHVGDIETNYPLEKVKQVYPAAMMVARYGLSLPPAERDSFLFPMPKMVIGVGKAETAVIEKRFADLKPVFPQLNLLTRAEITQAEPAVVKGRPENEPINALHTVSGYAVDFESLAAQLVSHAKTLRPDVDVLFNHEVVTLMKTQDGHDLRMKDGSVISTRVLVVDADSYSLLLAKQLGYGKEFSLIPISGSFFFTRKVLHGKVYTVQDPKLPFAAVHGDPDVRALDAGTRFGPTAGFMPVLEARNLRTLPDFVRSSGFERLATWLSFVAILLDPVRFTYLLKNMLYELPVVGRMMFVKNVRKIVPNMRYQDVHIAKGYGGMRLQRVDTRTRELLLGEGKIMGDRAIFNMTPSPGASVCLYNAMRDAQSVAKFLGNDALFDGAAMAKDLYKTLDEAAVGVDVSLKTSYAS